MHNQLYGYIYYISFLPEPAVPAGKKLQQLHKTDQCIPGPDELGYNEHITKSKTYA